MRQSYCEGVSYPSWKESFNSRYLEHFEVPHNFIHKLQDGSPGREDGQPGREDDVPGREVGPPGRDGDVSGFKNALFSAVFRDFPDDFTEELQDGAPGRQDGEPGQEDDVPGCEVGTPGLDGDVCGFRTHFFLTSQGIEAPIKYPNIFWPVFLDEKLQNSQKSDKSFQ